MKIFWKRIGIRDGYDNLRCDPSVAKCRKQNWNPESDLQRISMRRDERRNKGAPLAKMCPIAFDDQPIKCRRRFLRNGNSKSCQQVTNRRGVTHEIYLREPGRQVEVLSDSSAKAMYTGRSTRGFDKTEHNPGMNEPA